jgi:TolB protein
MRIRCAQFLTVILALLAIAPVAAAQRRPVLPQIELPHPYYYREMYLPQLTSGPSSATWSPDSREVIYSMGGSLWRQRIDSNTAQQLTDGIGYDYQPDWSPDGKSVVYVSYLHDAMELWMLDLATGNTKQFTKTFAVNVEPRWSPDGKKIVFASTSYHGRFHIFVMNARDESVENKASIVRLTEETKSTLPRYYYAEYDTEIHPTWSRDGKEIMFVSNRGHIYGTGGFWRMRAEPFAEAREIHYEETTWKARPDFSPDGTKILYSSYLGRQWHQLWVMPANGGDAFPISYGDWDETYARWAPDGKRIAFISNRSGNTELWLQDFPGGGQRQLLATERTYFKPHGRIEIEVVGADGKTTAARVSATDAIGKFLAPRDAWISGADGYDREESEFEPHYFPSNGKGSIDVPVGKIHVEVMKGFEFAIERRDVDVSASGAAHVTVKLKAIGAEKSKPELAGYLASCGPGAQQCCPPTTSGRGDNRGRRTDRGNHNREECWVSSDLHVHMNYGGEYRNGPGHLVLQAEAENLGIVNNLIVNKEQRIPDIAYSGRQVDPASNARAMVVHGQEFHTTQWGHLGILNIRDGILLPGYAGYPGTAANSLLPMDADVADMAHARGALVGMAHPFDEDPTTVPRKQEDTPEELAADVALGKLDYLEVVGFNDYRATAGVWYRLLDLGFRIPAGAGTDAMANFASLRGPVGMDRVYARVPNGPLKIDLFLEALKSGKTVATNGPLLDFSLGGEKIGGEVKLDRAKNVTFSASLRSIVPVDHWELVCYGAKASEGGSGRYFVQELRMNASRDGGEARGEVAIENSGWCLVRASSEKSEYPILDNYVYGTTSPIYVTVSGKKASSREDAEYFVTWMDRTMAMASKYAYWNSEVEKEVALKRLKAAQEIYEGLR